MVPQFASLDDSIKKGFHNRFAAAFHAATLFILTCYYWIFIVPSGRDIIFERFCVDIMFGYIVYDTTHELFFTPLPSDRLTLAHHILGGISLLTAKYYLCQECMRLHMVIFLAEVSTPFLHLGWLLYNLGFDTSNSAFVGVLYGLVMVLFLVFRVILGPFLFWQVFSSKELRDEFPVLYYLNVVVVGCFVLLNMYWFFLLLRKAFPKKGKVAKGKASNAQAALKQSKAE